MVSVTDICYYDSHFFELTASRRLGAGAQLLLLCFFTLTLIFLK